MRSNKGLGRNYARRMRLEEERELAAQVKKPTSKELAKIRQDAKLGQRLADWFLYHQPTSTVVYTRDVKISNGEDTSDIDVTSVGTKRKSISNARHKLVTLQSRGARPRSIKRAKAKLELRITIEQDRKDRAN